MIPVRVWIWVLLAWLLVAVLVRAVGAETTQHRTGERHLAIGDVVAHVLPDGTAYAVQGALVLPLTPEDLRLTAQRVTLRLPDRILTCPLPRAALDEQRGTLQSHTGLTRHVVERFHVRTWQTDCPDGPGVIWDAVDHTTIITKGP